MGIHLCRLFEGMPSPVRGNGKRFIILYDDMCHLKRFMERRVDQHPMFARFVDETQFALAVDRFHYASHKGAYCTRHTNPDKVPELYKREDKPDGSSVSKAYNTSAAEQAFASLQHHRHHMNTMNGVRFRFMLQWVCWLHREHHGIT